MQNRELIPTQDGSMTFHIPELDETYHSRHGALAESRHVFIENGFKKMPLSDINVLELGFGTGLNFLLTVEAALTSGTDLNLTYSGIEKYPLTPEEIKLFYQEFQPVNREILDRFLNAYESLWGDYVSLFPGIKIKLFKRDFWEIEKNEMDPCNLIYFDCFGARVQPELWTSDFIFHLRPLFQPGALLTTYASKGSFRRSLQENQFLVEKIPGPLGKREMVNAFYTPENL